MTENSNGALVVMFELNMELVYTNDDGGPGDDLKQELSSALLNVLGDFGITNGDVKVIINERV